MSVKASSQLRTWRRAVFTGLWGTLTILALLVVPRVGASEMSLRELMADSDSFDGQAATLHGIVEKFREGVSPDGAAYYKFRLSDEHTAVRVFSFGRSPCRNGMQAAVEGIFEKANRLGPRPIYNEVTATHVTCR